MNRCGRIHTGICNEVCDVDGPDWPNDRTTEGRYEATGRPSQAIHSPLDGLDPDGDFENEFEVGITCRSCGANLSTYREAVLHEHRPNTV